MGLSSIGRTLLASTFLGFGSMPATANAQGGNKPALVKDQRAEQERIKQEIERAKKIIEGMQKEGLPPEEIKERAKILAGVLAHEIVKLEKGEELKVLTKAEYDALVNEVNEANQLIIGLLLGMPIVLGLGSFFYCSYLSRKEKESVLRIDDNGIKTLEE